MDLSASITSGPDPGTQGEDRRVLIVEDDRDVAHSLALLLAEPRVRIAIASDGIDGLRRAQELRPHLVLLDVRLPGADGFALLKALREDPELRETLVIFVTSLAEADAPARASSLGALAWLKKPFSEPLLLDTVNRALFGDSAGSAPDAPAGVRALEEAARSRSPSIRRFVLVLAPPAIREAAKLRFEQELGTAIAHAEDLESVAALGRSPLLKAIYVAEPAFGMTLAAFTDLMRIQRVTVPILAIGPGKTELGAP